MKPIKKPSGQVQIGSKKFFLVHYPFHFEFLFSPFNFLSFAFTQNLILFIFSFLVWYKREKIMRLWKKRKKIVGLLDSFNKKVYLGIKEFFFIKGWGILSFILYKKVFRS